MKLEVCSSTADDKLASTATLMHYSVLQWRHWRTFADPENANPLLGHDSVKESTSTFYITQFSGDRSPVCLSVCNVGVLWPNGWMDQDATWYGRKPWPRPHCVRLEHSCPERGTAALQTFRPCLLAKRSSISATAELSLYLRNLPLVCRSATRLTCQRLNTLVYYQRGDCNYLL